MFYIGVDREPTDRDFANGYGIARAMCLATGSRKAVQAFQELHQPEHSAAFWEGWSWAVWDYEDANGLPHTSSGR